MSSPQSELSGYATPQVLVMQSLSLVYRREARLSGPVRAAILSSKP
jgi:hypothetical protein